MSRRLRILIVGGYGTFGGRLAELLADEARLTLLIAGRSISRAAAFCADLAAAADLVPAVFDREGDLDVQLAALAPDMVVDASGPFQAYGSDPYRLVRACVAGGLNYLDLADGSDFVAGIGAFDAEAKSRDIFILSGVSSCPVLTAAVVRHLAADFRRVDAIVGGIAPSPYAGVGLNVISAIAAYAGQPTRLWRRGAWETARPLTETCRYTIAPPGRVPLHNTLFSLVEVPDLVLIPVMCPGVRSVWMGAGPVPAVFHRALIGLAWLVRWRLLPSLRPFAPLFLGVINRLRWGEHRGGMFVEMRGLDRSGASMTSSWHLLAEGRDGPLIPSMAVEAIIRRQLDETLPPAGARSAIDALDLADYDRMFARHMITTGVRRQSAQRGREPLLPHLLDRAWERLPASVRVMHEFAGSAKAEGRASIERGRHPLARAVAWMFRFPPAAADVPVSVTFERAGDGEVWHRRFGRHGFTSHLAARGGRWRHLLVERFGIVAFGLALVVDGERLHLVVRRWAVLGVPLPIRLAPVSRAWEADIGGRFSFDIDLSHPLIGRIVHYKGWLAGPTLMTPPV